MSASYWSPKSRQCTGKNAYSGRKQAKRAAKRTMAIFGGRKMDTYKCGWCARYHCGHASPVLQKLAQETLCQ